MLGHQHGERRSALSDPRVQDVGVLRARLLAAAAFLVVPAWMLHAAVGPFRVPGVDGPALHGGLLEGARLRAGLLDPWPTTPLASGLSAVLPVDLAHASGLVVAAAVWLAGFGPWLLAWRRASAPAWACLLTGVCVQLSPLVLRGVPEADLLALGVGPLALGLAAPRLAWLCAAWGVPVAAAFAGAGAVASVARRIARDRGEAVLPSGADARGWLIAGLWLLGGLASGVERADASTGAASIAPAYVADNGAVFPLPPAEAAPIVESARSAGTGLWLPAGVAPVVRANRFAAPAEPPRMPPEVEGHVEASGPGLGAAAAGSGAGGGPERAASSAGRADGAFDPGALLVPVQRLYIGPLALLGLCAALVTPRLRAFGAGGLALLVAIVLACGWQSVPGETPTAAGPGLAWAVLPVALAVPGIAWTFARAAERGRGAAWALAGVAIGAGPLLENPRLVVPVTALPPDPLVEALRGLEPGAVLIAPSPAFPWRQGQAPEGRVALGLAAAGLRAAPPDDPDAAAALLAVSRLVGLPVDVGASALAWSVRARTPFVEGPDASWRYLVVDFDAVPDRERARLDGWLAAQVGVPIARAGGRALYDRR
jgi:hypothetical protein